MKKYDVKSIMCKAWSIYRAADHGDGLKPVFALCLSMAWENAKNQPENVLEQWNSMEPKAQLSLLTACVKKSAKDEIARSTGDHYMPFYETVAWFLNFHGLDALVNEAWVNMAEKMSAEYLDKLNAKRAKNGKVNISLVALAYRSASQAIKAVYRDDLKHGRARVYDFTDKDGTRRDYLEAMASTGRDETQHDAVLKLALDEFLNGRDETDRMIVECRRDGYTEREIAAVVGMTCAAVHFRIDKLRAGLRAAGLTPKSCAA